KENSSIDEPGWRRQRSSCTYTVFLNRLSHYRNSVKKTLRLTSQDGEGREAVALTLFSLIAFPITKQCKENSSIGEPGWRRQRSSCTYTVFLLNLKNKQCKENSSIGEDEGDVHEFGVFTREFRAFTREF
ncbi:hypothetical protein, partial [Peribacillus simplex]|uniref:hypothetical protein n=1 Tax=Peribacillus simplex TaxID=1478 RepID=UPI003CF5191D